ncbi:S8 family serine peptidase [Amycolatopsis pigmentata]
MAAAADGFGISGVAPNVTLVSIRAADDSGSVYLGPMVDALTYAADSGIGVVNMSFYVDPWLYNCDHNPADTPQEQREQRTIVEAVTRALNYAYRKGVTSVVGLGNDHTDLGAPQPDFSSPDHPVGAARLRTIDNATCLSLPAEGPHTIGVSAFGPSGKKADYSDYGTERTSVSAPGGFLEDGYGTDRYRTRGNQILSAYPRDVAVEDGNVDADGNVTPDGAEAGVRKATTADGHIGYYQYLQGTSMATPHATGVAALIISHYGRPGPGGFGLNPDAVRRILEGTAAKAPCPEPRTVDYLKEGDDASYTAICEGTPDFNGFYGHGMVDAYAAVTRGGPYLG